MSRLAVPAVASVTRVPSAGAGWSSVAVTVTSGPPSAGSGAALSASVVGSAAVTAARVTVTV